MYYRKPAQTKEDYFIFERNWVKKLVNQFILISEKNMEEVWRRFPFLAENIFENVYEESLVKCKKPRENSTIIDSEEIKSCKSNLTNYKKWSELCFNDCIWDFSTEKLWKGEKNCSLNCAEKLDKASQIISIQFQEGLILALDSRSNEKGWKIHQQKKWPVKFKKQTKHKNNRSIWLKQLSLRKSVYSFGSVKVFDRVSNSILF